MTSALKTSPLRGYLPLQLSHHLPPPRMVSLSPQAAHLGVCSHGHSFLGLWPASQGVFW